MNLQRKPRTIAEVNKAIQQKFPDVILVKGHKYFYISSDNEEMGLKIAGLYTTSISVFSLGQQTIEKWVQDVEHLLSDKNEGIGGDVENN